MGMPLTHRRFTVDEYHRMAEAGILGEDDRVELLDGEIVQMSAIGPRHARCIDDITRLFVRRAGDTVIVRVQNPVTIDINGEPEPDLALLVRRPDRYGDTHPGPGDTLLVVEVADASLSYDRGRKVPAYARTGIPEVWIVDLTTDRIEVYREPHGETYTHREILTRGATLSPMRLPELSISVDEILG